MASEPKTMRKWVARRAGAGMTVYGEDHDTGARTKITNVKAILPPAATNAHEVLAIDKDGVVHRLIFI